MGSKTRMVVDNKNTVDEKNDTSNMSNRIHFGLNFDS